MGNVIDEANKFMTFVVCCGQGCFAEIGAHASQLL